MFVFFSFSCPTTEFKNDKIKHNNTVNSTSQFGRHWPEVFGLCLGIEAYPITKSILKRHFMPETFISIDNNLQRRVRLHNIVRLSHDTVIWNLHFYMPNVISEESLVFFCCFFSSDTSVFIFHIHGHSIWHSPIYSQNWNKNINSY